MTKEFLERLYWACSSENEIDADGAKLGELYGRTEEKNLLDNLDGSVAITYEKQGFINGFRLGMKLAGELRGELREEIAG